MWFMGDFVGDVENSKKIDFKKVKYGKQRYHFIFSKNASFRFSQRSGAQICVTHQMSFLNALEGWAKSDSWLIWTKHRKKPLGS